MSCFWLDLDRADISDGQVAPGSVVETLDVLEDLTGELLAGWPGLAVHELLLLCGEEALSDGVIETIALGSHRPGDPGITCCLTERERDVLLEPMRPHKIGVVITTTI